MANAKVSPAGPCSCWLCSPTIPHSPQVVLLHPERKPELLWLPSLTTCRITDSSGSRTCKQAPWLLTCIIFWASLDSHSLRLCRDSSTIKRWKACDDVPDKAAGAEVHAEQLYRLCSPVCTTSSTGKIWPNTYPVDNPKFHGLIWVEVCRPGNGSLDLVIGLCDMLA